MRANEKKENQCPGCENHCPPEDLKCPTGMEYFGVAQGRRPEPDLSTLAPADAVVLLLRKCGHYLHHNAGREVDSQALLAALSEEETKALSALLKKCVDSWNG